MHAGRSVAPIGLSFAATGRIREHAIMMGMILPEDEELLWIAEESLLAPLPEGMPESGRAV